MRDHFGPLPIVAGMGFSRDVMLLDDCQGAFTYIVGGTGGDDVHEYLAAAAFSGSAGLHLKTRTTNAQNADNLYAYKYLNYPETGLIVARCRFNLPAQANTTSLNLSIAHYNAVRGYLAQILFTPATPKVEYADSAGNFQAIAAMAYAVPNASWQLLELAIDCLAHKYLYVRFAGVKVDLSTIDIQDTGANTNRYSYFGLTITASASPPSELYASHIYVGENLEA